ncbi:MULTISPECIES: helix-turn-helix domain-containing protein [Vibrio]|uniref:AraC family transcriptional regulator n=1 Tax=Vibrio chanodichtyis TaxID=3027932 RepID=A0ABT5UY37_9VIBR|nr:MULTISPECIES: AraC family transcriptional regulator [Vibrio]MDE1514264.1 AraC family transcriptional regulator [Vibrio chanodichtyis]
MRPLIENVMSGISQDWVLREFHSQDHNQEFACPWHYHTEYELVLYQNPDQRFVGNYFAGDAIGGIEQSTLLLYGPGLPHMIAGRQRLNKAKTLHSTIIWFKQQWLDKLQLVLPHTQALQRLQQNSAYGLHLSPQSTHQVIQLLTNIEQQAHHYQTLRIIEALLVMADDQQAQRLSVAPYLITAFTSNSDTHKKIQLAKQYIEQHHAQAIKITDLCHHLHLSESSAYRLFEKHYGMSFSEHLKQFRIGKACELLASSSVPIALIAERTGFGNLSNFNRQFKALKAITPRVFRQRFQAVSS